MAKNKPCEECGARKPDVDWTEDPFDREVNNKSWMRYLCADCYQDRVDEA